VLAFHYQFELIHPFFDGNGRVGRMVMFSQCLTNGVQPFIVVDDRREEYLSALNRWPDNPQALAALAADLQSLYKEQFLYLIGD
jgi:Fic family protein